jgi:hypothetical protein
LLALASCLLGVSVLAADMFYAGQQARTTKALSDEDIAALSNGEGKGMAKAAELNGYPGPSMCSRSLRSSGLPKQVPES